MMSTTNRRILRTRTRAWPSAIARALARSGFTPNQVSLAGIAFAALAAFAFVMAAGPIGVNFSGWLALAALGIQLRLLCNLLDGLLAIEGGLKSPTGDLFNEIPDRIEDILIMAAAGVTLINYRWGLVLGLSAAALALGTAYVRLLGGSLGLPQDFGGPMAKQHRMFVLTLGALAAAAEHALASSMESLRIALAVIVVGSAVTIVRRTLRIARLLRAR